MQNWRVVGAVVGAAVVGVGAVSIGVASASPVYNASFSYTAPLERAPYVTDLTTSTAELNWATSTPTPGYATYGPGGSCTQTKVLAGKTLPPFVPNVDNANATTDHVGTSPASYQYSIQLTSLGAGAGYCYQVFSSAGVALAASQSFSTLDASTSTAPLTFDVVGDLGETTGADESSTFVNEDQAAIDDEIGASGAKFIVTAGDVGYSGGTDADYGDLTVAPTSATSEVSNIFGPAYWPQTKGIPMFAGDGNHGAIIAGLRTWPEEAATQSSGGTYAFDVGQVVDGVTASAPDAWYAFSDGGVRIYVLDASWGDNADGTDTNALCPASEQGVTGDCRGYQMDDSAHWQPTSAEMKWLKTDLASHPGGIKMAVFHYPVQSVGNNQPSDPYLERDLVPVLQAGGVSMTFSGHNHTYQRFSPATGLISYVTGGGGGTLEPVDGNNDKSGHCAAAIATEPVYAIGYGSTGSSACTTGNTIAQKSMSPAQVYNFLKVTVNNGAVTVTPENALGATFDQQTYQLGGGTPPTTTTTSTTSTTGGSTTTTTSGSGTGGIKLATSAGASGASVSLPQAATTGELLVYSASQYTGATNHVSAVSDNAGDPWTKVATPDVTGHNSEGELWYTYAMGSVSTVTATTKATSIASEVQVFSGVTPGAVPASGSGSNTGTAASASATAGSLEVGFVAGHGNAEAITLGSGLSPQTQVQSAAGTSISTLTTGYETSGGTGTFSGTFPTAMYWAAGVATFPA